MSIKEIMIYPAEVLKKRSESVEVVDDEIRVLVDDMAETMYAAPGVGLAANQVGVTKRIAVIDIDHPEGESDLLVLINPEIVERSGEIEWEEGCLSVPDIHVKVQRSQKVRITALNRDGKAYDLEAQELLAVAIQHEIDHLDGITLANKMSFLQRKMAIRELKNREN